MSCSGGGEGDRKSEVKLRGASHASLPSCLAGQPRGSCTLHLEPHDDERSSVSTAKKNVVVCNFNLQVLYMQHYLCISSIIITRPPKQQCHLRHQSAESNPSLLYMPRTPRSQSNIYIRDIVQINAHSPYSHPRTFVQHPHPSSPPSPHSASPAPSTSSPPASP